MARKTAEEKEKARLDKEIDLAWNHLASGVQVNIMDIPKIFRECRAAYPAMSIEDSVKAAISKYRQN